MSVQTRKVETVSVLRADMPYPSHLLIGQVVLAAPGLVTFPPAGVLPVTFNHLLIVGTLRSVRANQPRDTLGIRFGTGGGAVDAGANYGTLWTQITNITPTPSVSLVGTSAAGGQIAGNTAPANEFTAIYISIPNYNATAFYKQVQWMPSGFIDALAANCSWNYGISEWRNTGGITSLQLAGWNAWDNFATGSRVYLYGVL